MRIRIGALLVLAGLLVVATGALAEVTTTVSLDWAEGGFSLRPAAEGSVSVAFPEAVSAAEPGQPDLPWVVVRVPVPDPTSRVTAWTFEPRAAETLARGVRPAPAAREVPSTAGDPPPATPDLAIYGGRAAWPSQPAVFRGIQVGSGNAVAIFLVSPLRWDPFTGNLERFPGGTLRVSFGAGSGRSDVVIPRRAVADDVVRSDATAKAAGPTVLHSFRGGVAPKTRPSLDSVPVEFLIVTTPALAPAFQPLVDWKNRAGYPAAVRTIDEISAAYPQGVDLAESIRLFLKDAYALWGTRTVIIGGDPSLVPIRYARSYTFVPDPGTSIATDYYYACLDGNWNADGDAIWGEAVSNPMSVESDSTDLVPELSVGRVSAVNAAEVSTWIQKYMKYARDPDLTAGYLDNVLTLGEVLFEGDWRLGDLDSCLAGDPRPCVTNDGATECFRMIDSLRASTYGAGFSFDELYERDYWWNPRRGISSRPLNRTNTIASLNAGRNIVFQMGHGDRDRWAIGSGRLLTSDVASLTNGAKVSGLAYAANCNSGAVDADCVGEAWQFAPNGGGVNYFGSTNLDFPVAAGLIQNYFFHYWMNELQATPGSTYKVAAEHFATILGDHEGTMRFLLFSLILLGDPDLNIWRTRPEAMQVTAPATFSIGAGTARVTVRDSGGRALAGARVCFYKENDALGAALTAADGSVDVPFTPTSTGAFRVTVTHPLAKPYLGDGTVSPGIFAWPVLADVGDIHGYSILDDGTAGTRGNGNGRIEAGETVALSIAFANRGTSAATGVTARLRTGDGVPALSVAIADSTQAIGDLGVDGTGTSANAFLLTVRSSGLPAPGAEDRVALPLVLTWESQGGSHAQTITPEVDRPELHLIHTIRWETALPPGGEADSIPNNGETMALIVELANSGRGTWSHLRARLEPVVRSQVTLLDSLAAVPTLFPGMSATSDTLRFQVRNEFTFRLSLVIEDTTGTEPVRLWSRLLRLRQSPSTPPATVQAMGEPNSITLSWGTPPNSPVVWGYRIYRSATETGPFERLAPGYVRSMRGWKDEGLPDMTRFWYQVAAIDSSGIEGPRTPIKAASSAPGLLSGWPVSVDESRDACPTIENLNGWGPNEIVLMSNTVYCFSALADDYYDGDGVPSSRGVLTKLADGQNFNGKCAVEDINGDGKPEVIALATNNMNGNWTPPSALCVYDYLGNLLWSKVVAFRPATSAVAIGNIDDDPELEIVFLCGKWLYAYNADGTPFGDKAEGKLMAIPGSEQNPTKVDFQLASPALADLDDDGMDEIVFTSNSADASFAKLYVIKALTVIPGNPPVRLYATNLPGFPFTYSSAPGAGTDQASNASPAIADVSAKGGIGTPDGKPDIIISTRSRIWVFDPWVSGADKLVWSKPLERVDFIESPLNSSPAVGDIDGDGYPEIVAAGGKGYLYVLDGRNGNAKLGFYESASERYKKVAPTTARLGSPILADLDGVIDGPTGKRLPEVVIGDNLGTVYAFRKDGAGMNGFPFVVPGGKIGIGLAAWDVDRDGYQNLVIQSDKVQEIRVLDFKTCPLDPTDRVANPWPAFRHDSRNTGALSNPPWPTPIQTVALAAEAGASGVTLRWQSDLSLHSFRLSRAVDPGGDLVALGEWPADQVTDAPGSYVLRDVPPAGTWRYRIEALDLAGQVQQSGETVVTTAAEATFRLHPAHPNPFNPHTVIRLDLPHAGPCDLRVVDAAGRTVRQLLRGPAGPGSLEVTWDGKDDAGRPAGSGVFFVRAAAEGQGSAVQKVVLLK